MYQVYSKYVSTTASEDILATIQAALGDDSIRVKRLELKSANSFTFSINGLVNSGGSVIWNEPFNDGTLYSIELEAGEVLINSLKIKEILTSSLWVFIEF